MLVLVRPSAPPAAPPPAAALPPGLDTAGMDTTVAPGDDFYAYANGGWLKATPIPPDKASYGAGSILSDQTRQQTVALIQDAGKAGPGASAETRKVADFYAAFMDEAGIEARGLAPLKPALDAIAQIADRRALARAIGGTIRADVDPLNATNFETEHLFGVWIAQGMQDPAHNMPYLLQGGLGLPDRDYYVSPSPKMAALRKAYGQHVVAVLGLMGVADASRRAAAIVDLETRMAAVHATRVQSADVSLPQVWTREALAAKAPGLDWPALLDAAGLQGAPAFTVWHPAAVTGLAALAGSAPLAAWKDWLAFHTVNTRTGFLPKAFVDEGFAFYGKTLNGTPAPRPRWQRGVDATSARAGRGGRPRLRRTPLPARGQGQGPRDGRRPDQGVQPPRRRADVDDARDEGAGQGQGVDAVRGRRLSRQVDRLRVAADRQGRRDRQRASAPSCSSTAGSSPSWDSRSTGPSGG